MSSPNRDAKIQEATSEEGEGLKIPRSYSSPALKGGVVDRRKYMIKIRYPTRKGDVGVTLEMPEAREEVYKLQMEGVLLAKEEDREIIKSPKEIKDGDTILAFPRISGGI